MSLSCRFYCATWSFPGHKFRQWANLASIFLVISLLLEQQTWFRVCVLPVVPITFPFHHSFDLMSSSINYIFLKTFDKFVVIIVNNLTSSKLCVEIQDEKYHPCPLMNCVIIDNILASPQHKLVHILCCILISLLSNLCYVLPWSITIIDVKNVVSITKPLKNSWYMWYFLPYPFLPWSPCCF